MQIRQRIAIPGALQCYLRLGTRSVRFALPLPGCPSRDTHIRQLVSDEAAWALLNDPAQLFVSRPRRRYVASSGKKRLRGHFRRLARWQIKV